MSLPPKMYLHIYLSTKRTRLTWITRRTWVTTWVTTWVARIAWIAWAAWTAWVTWLYHVIGDFDVAVNLSSFSLLSLLLFGHLDWKCLYASV